MTDVVSAKPRIAINAVQSQNLFIERTGALECLDVENGFQNAEERRHLLFPFPMRRSSPAPASRKNNLSRSYPATGTISSSGMVTSRVTALAATTARCCA